MIVDQKQRQVKWLAPLPIEANLPLFLTFTMADILPGSEITMKLSQTAIKEFRQIYREEFGEILSDQEAYEKASGLLRLFEVIYRPLPGDVESCNRNKTVIQ